MQFFAVVAMSIALLGYSKAVPLENAPRSSGLTPIYKTCHKDGLTALTMDDGVFKYVSFSSSLVSLLVSHATDLLTPRLSSPSIVSLTALQDPKHFRRCRCQGFVRHQR